MDVSKKFFSEEQNCYFDTVFASLIIVCYDFLRFSKKKNSLLKSMCIETILSEDIYLMKLSWWNNQIWIEMVNYFVCLCLFDFALFSNFNGINEFIESMEKKWTLQNQIFWYLNMTIHFTFVVKKQFICYIAAILSYIKVV